MKLKEAVDFLVEHGDGDPEANHGSEDELMRWAVRQFAPADVLAEFERLWAADFRRWYA